MVYYNENDPKAAAWLRELIRCGHIAKGTVDERSITEVEPVDLAGFRQCHFFAGIGGWSYALRLGCWPDDRPVWTGSCPCQPFSVAGKRAGEADERHLWPIFGRLIGECGPAKVFGEQVASAAGREWLARVRLDLEGMGYGVGAADLCAAGVGAPHIRQRLYWVADPDFSGHHERSSGREQPLRDERIATGGLGDAVEPGLEGFSGPGSGRIRQEREIPQPNRPTAETGDASDWSAFDLLPCSDGKARRVESGTFPLAHGIPARMGRLRGYGNAIVPQVAAVFIRACA